MSIYGSAVKKPITTIMVFLALIIFGVYSLVKLPVDMYPEIEFPAITVFTTYVGASASDIETNISRPIEDALNSIDNLKEITSQSRDNVSVVSLEFEYETDLSEAANDIRDAIGLVENMLPDAADKPTIFKFSSSMIPILMYAVTADESYEGLEKLLDDKVINPLNRVEGIGSVSLIGKPIREITIGVNPRKLEAYNITVEQIGDVLRSENMNMPAGSIKMGQMDYALRVEGEFKQSDFIKNIVLGNFNGQSIYLKDVATVRDSIKEMTIDERINGKQGVRLMVMKQSGANTVKIATNVHKQLEKLRETLPGDIVIEKVFDSSEFISGSINNLTKTLMYALGFVALVVFVFLGRWRATFIIVLTIPISLVVLFIYLQLTGSSINIISLSALSIAIGMVVDDAIVVLENITKHIERGASPREAAIYATNEVWLAVIVTTLTILAVFLPMTMLSGITGVLFRELGWIVSITVVTSTVTAITLTPMLSAMMLRIRTHKVKPRKWSYDNMVLPVFDKIDLWYGRVLQWSISHKTVITVITFAIFIGSLFLFTQLGTEFMPQSDEGRLSVMVELQSGTRVEKTVEVARRIDKIISEYPEVVLVSTSAGSDSEGGMAAIFQTTGSNIINYTIRLADLKERDRSVWEIAEEMRTQLNDFPEITHYNVSTGGGGMATSNVDVEIYGYDLDRTTLLANNLAEKFETIPGARDITISREKARPELRVELDREKMSAVGLNTAMVSTALYNRVAGLVPTKFREDGDEYDIRVRFNEDYRSSITDIQNITLKTVTGQMVKLGEVGSVIEYWSPPNIERKRRERMVTITVSPYKTSLGELADAIQAEIGKQEIPREMLIEVGGAYKDQQEGFMDIAMLLVLSLVLVYIVMASQFESLKMPLIIMFSIPFAFTGVILALYITNTTLSVIAGLGAVMLVGIVVKNAIVLVDYINLMRDRGYELDKAIVLSGQNRLRPVLMTALTTILGMLPLALSTGEGAEIWSPMGISVIGGLIFSTIITMIIVPVIYRAFASRGERNKKMAVNKKFAFLDE
ncbi:efflux RND transporter permease subunit [Candidatus Falkowbacteria bacterium]|nr:efflux RND transporter permease subunit [Candidatus Falkowbacteria bacterium]